MSEASVDLAIIGSIGIDTIHTPTDKRESILGGTASFACAAASFFSRVGMVAVVGDDFSQSDRALYEHFGIDTEGLETVAGGKTFRWTGRYEENMNVRTTLVTELNVLGEFSPKLPSTYAAAPYVFLANMTPLSQLEVLEQLQSPRSF